MSHSQLYPQLAVVPWSVLVDKSRAFSACSLVRGGGGLEGSGDFSSDTTSLFCCMDDRHKPAPSILPALTGHTSGPPALRLVTAPTTTLCWPASSVYLLCLPPASGPGRGPLSISPVLHPNLVGSLLPEKNVVCFPPFR